MKNPFKKSSIMDTVVNVGVGGAANVAVDYAWGKVDFLAGLGATTKNAIKIAGGAVLGSMVKNKYVRAAADGIAVAVVAGMSIYSLTTAKRADSKATQALTEVRGVEASLARNNAGYTGYGAVENQAFLAQFQKR